MTAEPVGPEPGVWPAGALALTTVRDMPGASPGPFPGFNLADHVGDDPDRVRGHRDALAKRTGITAVQWLNQVHGNRVVACGPGTVGQVPEADAAWTRERGFGLAVLTADCVPAVIVDRHATVVGVAHGGWRGLVGGVLTNLVTALPVPPQDQVAWLGPAIGPVAYEVGDEVAAAVTGLPDGELLGRQCLRPGKADGKWLLDLFALSECLLHRAGVPTVLCERLCTFSDRRFYSYRRDGRTGRMATLGWLAP